MDCTGKTKYMYAPLITVMLHLKNCLRSNNICEYTILQPWNDIMNIFNSEELERCYLKLTVPFATNNDLLQGENFLVLNILNKLY